MMLGNNKIITLGTIRDNILIYYPNLLWWDGVHKHQVFNSNYSYKHRQGMENEIRIEFDSSDINNNFEAINFVCCNLSKLKYSFALYYVEGGRSPHIHIYDLDELELLTYEQRTEYRRQFIKSISGDYNPDYELCDEKHLCALEFVNHFKYNKPKELLSFFFNGNNMSIDLDIKLNVLFTKEIKKESTKKIEVSYSNYRDCIIENCNFEKILDHYKISHKGHMALCPFHNDSNYSLSFTNANGLWKCFGCNNKGDIISLVKLLEVKNG